MASTNSPEESSSNPQRPPLTDEEKEIIESDKIGDSAYSKKWVLGVLMHLLQDMSREKENGNKKYGDDDDDDGFDDKNGVTIENGEVIDLNLEQELCELWDMTMDAEVSRYLNGQDAIDMLLEAIVETKSLRKLEICIGILANMACTSDVCKIIVEHPTLSLHYYDNDGWLIVLKNFKDRDLEALPTLMVYATKIHSYDIVLFQIDNPDVRTLIELSRLISVCLSNKDCFQKWIKALKSRSVTDKLIFILENSLNVELLDGVSEALDRLLDQDDSVLKDLSTTDFVNIICDVYRRTAIKRPQAVQTLLHILQMISTTEKGVSALASVEDSSKIARIILIESSKYFTPLESNFPSLVSSCSILNVLMAVNKTRSLLMTKKDMKILSAILSLTEALWEKISHDDNEDSEIIKESEVHSAYFTAVTDYLLALVETFSDVKVGGEVLDVLKDQSEQISRVIDILKGTQSQSPIVEKMINFLRNNEILEGKEK